MFSIHTVMHLVTWDIVMMTSAWWCHNYSSITSCVWCATPFIQSSDIRVCLLLDTLHIYRPQRLTHPCRNQYGCQPADDNWNTLGLEHNGRYFVEGTFQSIFVYGIYVFWLQYHRSLFPMMHLTMIHQWLRQKFDIDQATSHNPNHWWPSLVTNICVIRNW